MSRTLFFSLLFVLCGVMTPGGVHARAIDDGFVPAQVITSSHFSIQLAAGVDAQELVRRLDIGPGHRILAGQSLRGDYGAEDLGELMDALFKWACGVLDMQLYTYKGTVKVVADGESMKGIVRRLFGRDAYSEKGFYVFDNNTLYIAVGDFTKEIMGHEMAHAVISNFFVVQPPEKVQEVLAGYIEYQIRKGSVSRP